MNTKTLVSVDLAVIILAVANVNAYEVICSPRSDSPTFEGSIWIWKETLQEKYRAAKTQAKITKKEAIAAKLARIAAKGARAKAIAGETEVDFKAVVASTKAWEKSAVKAAVSAIRAAQSAGEVKVFIKRTGAYFSIEHEGAIYATECKAIAEGAWRESVEMKMATKKAITAAAYSHAARRNTPVEISYMDVDERDFCRCFCPTCYLNGKFETRCDRLFHDVMSE